MSQSSRRAIAEDFPRRGEVWIVAFQSSAGGEVQKTRPAVVVSNDRANRVLNRVQVVPISSSVERLYPAEAYVSVAGERRKAMADQITTAGKPRLLRRIDTLAEHDQADVCRAIRVQLDL